MQAVHSRELHAQKIVTTERGKRNWVFQLNTTTWYRLQCVTDGAAAAAVGMQLRHGVSDQGTQT